MSGERPPGTLLPWLPRNAEPGPDLPLFRVRHAVLRNPLDHGDFRAVILDTPDWVNVIALTAESRVVLVRQFRFGSLRFSLETPGGMVDRDEEPRAAAERELREETGYTSPRWELAGLVEPNPAFHNNRCFTYVARAARRTHRPEPDLLEQIEVLTRSPAEVRELVTSGAITNSLIVAGLARVLDLRNPEWQAGELGR